MGKFKFTMRTTNPNKEGLFAVMLEITKSGKRSYISLKVYGESEYWDEVQERFRIEKSLRTVEAKEKNNERINNNMVLDRYKKRAAKIFEEFDEKRIDWSLNQFKDAFVSKIKQGKFHPYISRHIKMLHETNHTGNAVSYENLKHMLSLFDEKIDERVFGEIDIKYVKEFDVFLQKRKIKGNTRKYYLKTLRATLNKAIQDGEATNNTYPFGKGGFKISALEEETAKRYLPKEYLLKLKTAKSIRPVREYARKLFLFSYYCYGISFVDMAQLKTKNILLYNNGRYIVYKRQKTKSQRNVKPIQIKVNVEIQNLINDLRQLNPIEDYLLPIITLNHKGEELYTHIKNKSKQYNKHLKKLASEFEFEFNLTSYVSRHTMAMQLQSNSIPREVISQILGHSDLQTTNVYLDSLDSSFIDEAAKVL